ncbi:MAG: DUF4386 domain-containing protein [Anaerolineaceae bacterium]|nr:DUF4386 domain-containing protein [Anaerolineaceae bacterium]
MEFSLEKKEGKNEKNLYDHDYFVGTGSPHVDYLVYKSGFLPRILGIILMAECFGWLLYPILFFFFPGSVVLTYLSSAVGFIGEFSLMLWLLIMGAKDQKPA